MAWWRRRRCRRRCRRRRKQPAGTRQAARLQACFNHTLHPPARPATCLPAGLQLEPNPRAYKWWQEQELKDLCNTVGLLDFRRARSNRFIIFAATKPL